MFRIRKIAIKIDHYSQARLGAEVRDEYLRFRDRSEGATEAYPIINDPSLLKVGQEAYMCETGRLGPTQIKTSPIEEIMLGSNYNYAQLKNIYGEEFRFAYDDHDEEYENEDLPGNFVRVLLDRSFFRTQTSIYAIETFTAKDRREECLDKENQSPSNRPLTDLSSHVEPLDS